MKVPRLKKKASYRAVNDGDLSQPIELHDFMQGVGRVMKLPEKAPATPVKTVVAVPDASRKPRSRIVVTSIALISVIVIGLGLSALIPKSSDPLPGELVGRWFAASPRYAERGLEFRDGALYMKRGAEESELVRLAINRVRVTPKNNGSLGVMIDYLENGSKLTLDLTLHDYAGLPVIELRNLPDVLWRKAPAASPNSVPDAFLPPAFRQ